MKDKVLQFCRREELLHPGDRVVCGLSGGADSVALTHLMLSLRQDLGIEVTAAHYNHCLRGEASREDEAFVRRLCASWGISCAFGEGDVAAFAAKTGRSVEEAARVLRYDFLRQQPGILAVAHHGDDQVETVLLNLLRGTGLRGLAAMAPKQDNLIRPLLCVTRNEILAYLEKHNLPHREDHTNLEDDALRNRLRHHVIPLLEAENPSLSRTVGRMTGLLRQDEAYLTEQTQNLLDEARREGGWDCQTLLQAPGVLRTRAIRQLLTIPKPAMVHVEAVEGLLADCRGSASVQLTGGVRAVRAYGLLRLETERKPEGFGPLVLQPGETGKIEEIHLEISVSDPVILEKSPDSLCTFAIKYDMIKNNPTITCRARAQGDVLQLPGGSRSLKRLMIDRKIPASERGLLPVLETGAGLAGVYGVGADARLLARPGEVSLIVQIKRRDEK